MRGLRGRPGRLTDGLLILPGGGFAFGQAGGVVGLVWRRGRRVFRAGGFDGGFVFRAVSRAASSFAEGFAVARFGCGIRAVSWAAGEYFARAARAAKMAALYFATLSNVGAEVFAGGGRWRLFGGFVGG